MREGQYSKSMIYARKLYEHVLKQEKTNLYAANGLGVLLAEQCEFEQVRLFARLVGICLNRHVTPAHIHVHIYANKGRQRRRWRVTVCG